MRADPDKTESFEDNKNWGEIEMKLFERSKEPSENQPSFVSTPFSGNERNRLFMQRGDHFVDMSLLSGVDYKQDGRGFAIFDFDRDGWQDLAIVSPNQPRFRIARNRIGAFFATRPGYVDVELVGGQITAEPSTEWSSRDAIGAMVRVKIAGSRSIFQLSCGEGLSSQNAKRIHIGLGDAATIDELIVEWPSGKKTVRKGIPDGSRLTILENEAVSKFFQPEVPVRDSRQTFSGTRSLSIRTKNELNESGRSPTRF